MTHEQRCFHWPAQVYAEPLFVHLFDRLVQIGF